MCLCWKWFLLIFFSGIGVVLPVSIAPIIVVEIAGFDC